MKILILKNKLTTNIDDDINKFKDWLKRKTPLTYEFKETITNFDVKLNDNAGGPNKTGIGLIEANRILSPYASDVIIFFHDVTDIQKQFVAKTYALLNNKTIVIEVPVNKFLESIDDLYRLLTHEIIHAFHTILRLKGIKSEDTMDIYDGEMDIEHGNNRIRNLIMIGPYWKKFDTSLIDTALSAIGITPKKYKWFKDSEVVGLKEELVTRLDAARELSQIPFKITSGYRTVEHNNEVGGAQGSSHTLGIAVDVLADTNEKRFKILKGLLDAGFTRLGIYYSHIHADLDKNKPQNIAWYS